jgi:hypothetical protein
MGPRFENEEPSRFNKNDAAGAPMAQGVQLTPHRCRQWIDRIQEPAALCRGGVIASVNRPLLDLLGAPDDSALIDQPPSALIEAAKSQGLALESSTTALSLHEEAGTLLLFRRPDADSVDGPGSSEPTSDDAVEKVAGECADERASHPMAEFSAAAATMPPLVLAQLEALAERLWELPADAMVPAREILQQLRAVFETAETGPTDPLDLSEMLTRALQKLDPTRFRLNGDERPMLAADGERAAAVVFAVLQASTAKPDAIIRLETSTDATGAPVLELSLAMGQGPIFESEELYRLRGLVQALHGSLIELESGCSLRLRLPAASD